MRNLRAHRRWLTAALLTMLCTAAAVIWSPAAFAGVRAQVGSGSLTPTPTPIRPLMLASTGLDITVPIIIGLSVLALGTVMVGWAFLATGRPGRHR